MGRTGTLWAFEQTPVRPDVMTVAKSLASGLPVGAVLAAGEAAECCEPGDHGSTFGGGPLVAAAALATLDVIDDEAQLAHVRALGERLRAGLEELRGAGRLADVRGRGLMFGADVPGRAGAARGRERGARVAPRAERDRPRDASLPAAARDRRSADVDRVLAFLSEAL